MNGVAALVAVAGAYDGLAKLRGWETISTGYKRLRAHPVTRLAIGAGLGALIAHLYEREG